MSRVLSDAEDFALCVIREAIRRLETGGIRNTDDLVRADVRRQMEALKSSDPSWLEKLAGFIAQGWTQTNELRFQLDQHAQEAGELPETTREFMRRKEAIARRREEYIRQAQAHRSKVTNKPPSRNPFID